MCSACGTWHCDDCGKKRTKASRLVTQTCSSCGSKRGHMVATLHINSQKRRDHEMFIMDLTNPTIIYPLEQKS